MNLTIPEGGPIAGYLKNDSIRMPFIVLQGLIETILGSTFVKVYFLILTI